MKERLKRLSAFMLAFIMTISMIGSGVTPLRVASVGLNGIDIPHYPALSTTPPAIEITPEITTPPAIEVIPELPPVPPVVDRMPAFTTPAAIMAPFNLGILGPSATSARFYSFDLDTQGEWINNAGNRVFGNDGFVMFSQNFSGAEPYSRNTLINEMGYNPNGWDDGVAHTQMLQLSHNPANDRVLLSSGFLGYEVANATAYIGHGWMDPSSQPFVLRHPRAVFGYDQSVAARLAQTNMNQPLSMTFNLADNRERIVTLYVMNDVLNNWFTITDLNDNVILAGANQYQSGMNFLYGHDHHGDPAHGRWHGYISFVVNGSFRLHYRSNRNNYGNRRAYGFSGISAVFFDLVPEIPMGPSATMAVFHGFDLDTQGAWISYPNPNDNRVFGNDGFVMFQHNFGPNGRDRVQQPPYNYNPNPFQVGGAGPWIHMTPLTHTPATHDRVEFSETTGFRGYTVANATAYIGHSWMEQDFVLRHPLHAYGRNHQIAARLAQTNRSNPISMTFNMGDTQERLVTLYIMNDVLNNWFTITDLQGNVILDGANVNRNNMMFMYGDDRRPAAVPRYHGYISFIVNGSFILHYISNRDNERLHYGFSGISAVFFDTVPEFTATNWLEAAAPVPTLTWPAVPFFSHVYIYRSASATGTFNRIATVNAPSRTFTDETGGLISGRGFYYRARFVVSGRESALSDTVRIEIPMPDMGASNLTAFLGVEHANGNWVGRYGSLGYIIPGMAKVFAPGNYIIDGWVSGWRDLDPNYLPEIHPVNDHFISLPYFVERFYIAAGNRLVFSPDDHATDNRILQVPPGATGPRRFTRIEGRPGRSHSLTFILNCYEPRVFTFYSVMTSAAFNAQIRDLQDNIIVNHRFEGRDIIDGAYVSFMVSGSFTLYFDGDGFSSGFFFDNPSTVVPANVTTVVPDPGREVTLNWTNAPNITPSTRVIIERSEDNVRFVRIANLPGNTTTFTDTDLTPNQTYIYRLRYIDGINFGISTPPVLATIPHMDPTEATMLSVTPTNVAIGDTITAVVQITQEDGTPIPVGTRVNFLLTGNNVGDGVSVGQAIDGNLGHTFTNAAGVATFAFTARFQGQFGVKAYTRPIDAYRLDGTVSNELFFTVSPATHQDAPTIFRLSDAVVGGSLISINGSDFNDNASLRVFIQRDTGGSAPGNVSGATELEIVQRDRYGHFIVAQMPANAAPGVYNVWIQNEHGLSTPFKMNAARAHHISDYEIFPGIEITVVGRNFAGSEFNAPNNTQVRLNNGSAVHATSLISLTPFSAVFTIGTGVPVGTYFVEVSSDGGNNWSRLSSGQTLRVVPGNLAQDDPLGLGVAWARDFNWQRRVNVIDFGAVPNDNVNDTAAVQAAVNAVAAQGGGVVFFPNGRYYIDTITLPSNVVLLGESRANTRLYYTGQNGVNFINTIHIADGNYTGVVNRQGVARMSLMLTDQEMRPDAFIWLGQRWGDSFHDKTLRNANRLFVFDVFQECNFGAPTGQGSGRGMGILFIAEERVLIKNNFFRGHRSTVYMTGISYYYILRNNHIEYAQGKVHSLARYFFAENNTIKAYTVRDAQGNIVSYGTHGIMARDSSFMANNFVSNMGNRTNRDNDGEAICVEVPAGYHNTGNVLGATATSITVAPVRPLVYPRMDYGTLSVVIIEGRGMGQLRRVDRLQGSTIHVTQPFYVTPDHTSRFTLISPIDNTTMYNNVVHDNAKGLWLFGNSFDGVIAYNTSVDSEGIFVWTNGNRNSGVVPGYFTRIVGNNITGSSWRSGTGGIGFNTGRSNPGFFSSDIFGFEVINNVVIGRNNPEFNPALANGITEAPQLNGIYAWATVRASSFDGVQGARDAVNIVITGNHVQDVEFGIHISRSVYGTIVRDNTFHNVVDIFASGREYHIPLADVSINGVNFMAERNTLAGPQVITTPPRILTIFLPNGNLGEAYSYTLEAVGDPVIIFVVTDGNLPPGLTLSATGVLSGTPNTVGTFTFTVTASNNVIPSDNRVFTLTIDGEPDAPLPTPPPIPTPTPPPSQPQPPSQPSTPDNDDTTTPSGTPSAPEPSPSPTPTPIINVTDDEEKDQLINQRINEETVSNQLAEMAENDEIDTILITLAEGENEVRLFGSTIETLAAVNVSLLLETDNGLTVIIPSEVLHELDETNLYGNIVIIIERQEIDEEEPPHMLAKVSISISSNGETLAVFYAYLEDEYPEAAALLQYIDEYMLAHLADIVNEGLDIYGFAARIASLENNYVLQLIELLTESQLEGFVDAINGNKIDEFETRITIKVDLGDLPEGMNHYRITAIDENGNRIGGLHDPETGLFVFETPITGDFTIEYIEDLRRIHLEIGFPNIFDLAQNTGVIMDALPFIENGRTMLPVRFIGEMLGANILWKRETREVSITLDGDELVFAIGEMAPGMDVPAQIIDSRTFVPLRFIAEHFNALVQFDSETRTIEVIF